MSIIFYILDKWAIIAICATIKMLGGALFMVLYMQVAELFPTSLRSTAYGMLAIVIASFVVFIPSVIASVSSVLNFVFASVREASILA